MNPINVMLGTAVVASLSAPSGTSASTLQVVRRFAAAEAATRCLHAHEAPSVSPRCALEYPSAATSVAGNALFAHTGNVVAFTVGRGLAQPAV